VTEWLGIRIRVTPRVDLALKIGRNQQGQGACPGGTRMDRPPRGPRGRGRVQGAAAGCSPARSGLLPDGGGVSPVA